MSSNNAKTAHQCSQRSAGGTVMKYELCELCNHLEFYELLSDENIFFEINNWNFNVQRKQSDILPTLVHSTLWLPYLLTYAVKMHCNVRHLDKVDEVGHNDANIEWSSDVDTEWQSLSFELLRTSRTLFFELSELSL